MTPAGPQADRLLGAFVGLAVGDALGTTLEFQPRDGEPLLQDMVGGGPFDLAPGGWTDDTAMALCLADALLAGGGRIDPHDLMRRFVRWWRQGENSHTGACFDIGLATRGALARFETNGDPFQGTTDPNSAGNGSLMRLAPVVLCWHADLGRCLEAADLQGRVTHGAPACRDACRYLARLLHALARGLDLDAALEAAYDRYGPVIAPIAQGSFRTKSRDRIRSSGFVAHSLEAALWAVWRAGDAREALLLAANLADDADTVAAIAGQIAGARFGLGGLPQAWVARLRWRDRIMERGRALLAAAGTADSG